MVVRQQALGHGHGQIGDAGSLDEAPHHVVALRIGCALAEDDQRPLGALEIMQRALDRVDGRALFGGRVDHVDQRLAPLQRIHGLAQEARRQVQINPTRAARNRCADRARDADPDILGMEDTIRRLAQRFGDGELVHLLVVALLQVDDLALGASRDQDHRPAVGGGMRQ